MTVLEAMSVIIWEARQERFTKRGYRDVCKALKSMPLTDVEQGAVLHALEYHDEKGQPYAWLSKKGK
jgi:hypothetical protein